MAVAAAVAGLVEDVVVGGEMVLQAQWIVPGGTEERRKATSARAWRGSTFPMASPVSVTTCIRFLIVFIPFSGLYHDLYAYVYVCMCVWGGGCGGGGG